MILSKKESSARCVGRGKPCKKMPSQKNGNLAGGGVSKKS
jgi:hypothetical protein